MSASSSKVLQQRIYGFDLLRIVTILAILFFHVWQYTFYQDQISLPPEISSYHLLVDFVGVVFRYGGLFIVALSFFLIGLKAKSQHVQRFIVLILGIIGLQILSSDNPMDPSTWDWDVYSYLVLSYVVVMNLSKNPKLRWVFVGLSILALSLPYEVYSSYLKIPEDAVQFTGWNIIPWVALPVLFHSLGVLWKENVSGSFLKLHKLEWPVWILAIAVLLWLCPDYGPFPAGPGFEAYVFKQKPLMFWQDFLIFTFLMRLSLDPRINAALGKIKPMQWVSDLAWNRRLGFCYLLQFVFIPLGPLLTELWGEHPRLFDWFWLFIFIMVELLARGVLKFGQILVKTKTR